MEPPSPAPVHLVPFARSVIDLLTVWPALQLSFEQSATHNSLNAQRAARSELATELVGAFLDTQPTDIPSNDSIAEPVTPSQEDIEDFLVSWIFGTLDVRIEDESEISITRDLIVLWKEWSRMTTLEDEPVVRSQGAVIQRIDQLAARQQTHGSRIVAQMVDEGHISGDEPSDDEDNMQVDELPTQRNRAPHQANQIVDEDGFTVVTKSSTRH